MELNIVWNEVIFWELVYFFQLVFKIKFRTHQIRAGIQTLQPKENKYIEPDMKFSRQKFVRNVIRIKAVMMDVIEMMKYIESVSIQTIPHDIFGVFWNLK
jgi:hypothetical protein